MINLDVAAPLGRWLAGLLLLLALNSGAAWAQAPVLTATTPAANAASYPPGSPLFVSFQAGLAVPFGGSTTAMKVFSAQRGGQRTGTSGTAGYLPFAPPSLVFTPVAYPFRPGETVGVSLTSAIVSTGGQPLAPPKVFQFTTATGGTGRGYFRPGSEPAAGGAPGQVVAADVDGDGDLDFVTADQSTGTLNVRLNGGNGTFGGGTNVAVPSGVSGVAVGDVDSDGDLDLVTAAGSTTATLTVLLNNGSGQFSVGSTGTLYYNPTRFVLGDIDGDGDLDLVINSGQYGVVSVRLNTGTGIFPDTGFPGGPVLGVANDLALADVDGDYDLDLLLVQDFVGGGDQLRVALNGGDASGSNSGLFGGVRDWPLMFRPVTLAVGDFNGDNRPDVALAGTETGNTAPQLVVRYNDGAGGFGSGIGLSCPANPQAVAAGDVNADGRPDLVLACGDPQAGTAGTLFTAFNSSNGAQRFLPATARSAALGNGSLSLALADVDNDGDLDALTGNLSAGTVSVRLNGPGPEINITQNGTSFPSGSTYDFGTVALGTSSGLRGFVIQNLSTTDDLTVTGQVATISAGTTSGSSLAGFPYVIPPGGSFPFSVEIDPYASGPQSATITLANDDFDEPAYLLNFVVNTAPTAVTWTGAVSTAWATAGNWNPAQVPGATTAVSIPVVARQPLVTTAAACGGLVVQPGASLTIAELPTAGYLTVGGNFLLQGGLPTDARLLLRGGTLEVQGDLLTNGVVSATGGLVALTGPRQQRLGGIGGTPNFWSLTVGPAGAAQVNPIGVQRLLTLRGDLLINGTGLFLRSDADGTAMVVNAGGQLFGVGFMERHISGSNAGLGYRHYSSPMLASAFPTVGDLATAGFTPVVNSAYNTTGNTVRPFPTVFGFDEARQGAAGVPGSVGFDQGWSSPAALTELLVPGRGYTVNLPGTSKVTLYGNFRTGPVAVGALSRSGSGPFAGYHLLGNPYPSPIDWGNVARPAGLDDAVYVFRSTGQYTGFYDFYANGLGTLAGGEIAAMQGFFVRVSAAVPAFTFTDAARLTTYSNPTFRRGAAEARPVLALALRSATGGVSGEADKAFIYFEAGASAAADARYDALKLPNPGGLGLASLLGGQAFAINGLAPLGAAPLLLPLNVAVPAPGRYELAVDQLLNFAPGTRLWLRDALLNTRTPLLPGTRYAFALAGTSAPGRFAVEFGAAGALATAAQVLAAQVALWPNPATGTGFVTVAAPAGATVAVLDALGRVVRPATVVGASGNLRLPTAGLAAGVYVLHVSAAAGEVSRRLVVE